MAHTQGTKSEISCLEEVDIEPVSFAGIVIVIKNISGKEEKSFARGCNISVSKVLLHLSFLVHLGVHIKEREFSGKCSFDDKGFINGSVHLSFPCSVQKLQL